MAASEQKLVFLGSKHAGLGVLHCIYDIIGNGLQAVITIDDRNDGRSAFEEILHFCIERNLPCHVATSSKNAEELILQESPDCCFVHGWYWIISAKTLEQIDNVVGIHYSLLPKYRGFAPLVWAMINGDKEAGLSLFSFDAGMDTGPVWEQVSVSIADDEHIGDVLKKLHEKELEVVKRCIVGILSKSEKAKPQTEQGASYAAKRIPDDGLITWSKPAQEVYNFIRAQSMPYPGAFSYLTGEKYYFWRVGLDSSCSWHGTAGQVVTCIDGSLGVICGDGHVVTLHTVQKDGEQVQSAHDSDFQLSSRFS